MKQIGLKIKFAAVLLLVFALGVAAFLVNNSMRGDAVNKRGNNFSSTQKEMTPSSLQSQGGASGVENSSGARQSIPASKQLDDEALRVEYFGNCDFGVNGSDLNDTIHQATGCPAPFLVGRNINDIAWMRKNGFPSRGQLVESESKSEADRERDARNGSYWDAIYMAVSSIANKDGAQGEMWARRASDYQPTFAFPYRLAFESLMLQMAALPPLDVAAFNATQDSAEEMARLNDDRLNKIRLYYTRAFSSLAAASLLGDSVATAELRIYARALRDSPGFDAGDMLISAYEIAYLRMSDSMGCTECVSRAVDRRP